MTLYILLIENCQQTPIEIKKIKVIIEISLLAKNQLLRDEKDPETTKMDQGAELMINSIYERKYCYALTYQIQLSGYNKN